MTALHHRKAGPAADAGQSSGAGGADLTSRGRRAVAPSPPRFMLPSLAGGRPPTHAVMVYWGSFMAQSNGSHARALSLLEFLRRRFDRVTLYSYADHPAEPWSDDQRRAFAARFADVELVLDPETRWLRLAKKTKEALVTLLPGHAAAILGVGLPGQAPGFARLRREPSTVFIVNYVDGLACLNGAPCERVVVETHDLKFLKRAKMAQRSPVSVLALLRLRNEIASLSASAGSIAITRAETTFFRLMLGEASVFCASIYDGEPLAADAERREDFDHDLLFAASENPLNERGLLHFLDENADWLGHWRIALCGRICERPAVRRCARTLPNLSLLGFVDDLAALYRRSRLCLSPTDGTGLKIKVVEALRHGKPVLASSHSMAGLPAGYGACVFPLDRVAAEHLLEDPAALEAAMAAARDYYSSLAHDGDQTVLADFLASLASRQKEIAS